MLKAVAFDLWETLITNTPDISRAQKDLRVARLEEVLVARGFGAVAERIEHAHRMVWTLCQELYWSEDRDVSCRRQIEHFLEELELDPRTFDESTLAAIEDAYALVAVEIPPQTIDGAAETLAALKARGLRIGLISNTGRTPGYALRKVLDALGLGSSIDVMVFSNEQGECKPQTSIFEELRRGLDVAFAEMMFVGDNLYADVHGAQRVGMRGVHFTPPTRGTAVGPERPAQLVIVPDAVVSSLAQLLDVISRVPELKDVHLS